MEIYTIGHSVHSKEKFAKMLHDNEIRLLADVRAFPGSKKFPQFSKDEFPAWLKEEGIEYKHVAKLGGRRRKSKEIEHEWNGGWNNPSFHNYADYFLFVPFLEGIEELADLAAEKRLAYCCSERHPSRCHRLIISNWLNANGWDVKHIIDGSKHSIEVIDHEIGKWGASPVIRKDGSVIYPA